MKDKQSSQIGFWGKGRARWCLLAAIIALIVGFMFSLGNGVVVAQTSVPETGAQTRTETREVTPDEVNTVARELWCPLCSGVRLDACELKACDQMKDVIAIKLAEGENTESIQAYFVEQYGPQVMGEPPRSGFNWLAWILPAVAAVVGGYFFWRNTQRMMQPATPLTTPLTTPSRAASEIVPPSVSNDQSTMAAQVEAAEKLDDADEYTQKLEEELAKYG